MDCWITGGGISRDLGMSYNLFELGYLINAWNIVRETEAKTIFDCRLLNRELTNADQGLSWN